MIAIAYEVKRYRRLLSETVRDGDTVVEIGPHIGKSTDGYVLKAAKAVLVDKGRDCAKALAGYAERHANVEFVCGDARGFSALTLAVKHAPRCDVLAVDLGGGRYPDTVFKVWGTWSGTLKPRDSVIRCRGLAEFIARGKVEDDTVETAYPDSGWLADYGRATPTKMKTQLEEFGHWVDIDKPDY